MLCALWTIWISSVYLMCSIYIRCVYIVSPVVFYVCFAVLIVFSVVCAHDCFVKVTLANGVSHQMVDLCWCCRCVLVVMCVIMFVFCVWTWFVCIISICENVFVVLFWLGIEPSLIYILCRLYVICVWFDVSIWSFVYMCVG